MKKLNIEILNNLNSNQLFKKIILLKKIKFF